MARDPGVSMLDRVPTPRSRGPRPAIRLFFAALAGLTSLVLAAGCSSREFDAVREYKVFLEEAKPSLQAMNDAREKLYQVDDPAQMLPLFRDRLLPELEALYKLSSEQQGPEGRLGEIHLTLKGTLERYSASTQRLVKRLESKSDDEREQAIVLWGEDDQKFGREMSGLVEELSSYLDRLKK